MLYLDHAATSWPKAPGVAEAVAGLGGPPQGWGARFESGRAQVARSLGIEDPDRLLLTPGATSALAVAIADLPWQDGDRAVLTGMAHHALHRPVQALETRGVDVVVLPRGPDGPVDLSAARDVLAAGGVRLVAASAASNVTGEVLPVQELAGLAHAAGARMLVDAAQSAGWLPVELEHIDLLAFTAHKGLQGPWGLGGLYVAAGVAMNTPGAVCTLDGPRRCADRPGFCDVGSVDKAALAGLTAALDWLDAAAQADPLGRARELAAGFEAGLARLGLSALGDQSAERRLPTVAVDLGGRPCSATAAALLARGLKVSGGVQCAPLAYESLGRSESLRFSFGPTTPAGAAEAALDHLASVL